MLKKLFNTLWDLFGWLIMGATFGLVGILGFTDFLVDGYNKPIDSEGLIFFFVKYPFLILILTLSVGFFLLALICVWGFFYRLINGKNP